MRKIARRRKTAQQDIEDAAFYYLETANEDLALRFIESVEATIGEIEAFPAMGSLRYGQLLDIPELRFMLVREFPYLVFYAERQDVVDIWRILHAQRHIPELMQE